MPCACQCAAGAAELVTKVAWLGVWTRGIFGHAVNIARRVSYLTGSAAG
jgi:hypothetical protein